MKDSSSEFPRLSVIVSVMNGGNTLNRFLDSYRAQTYRNKELVIMDGGSTDGTRSILESNDDVIDFWESKPDRGIFHAWNKALDRVSGDWVSFVGCDDYFACEDAIDSIASELRSRSYEVVSGRGQLVDAQGNPRRRFGEPWNWERMKRRQGICHPGSFYKTSLFNDFGRFSEKYRVNGDYEFNLRHGKTSRGCFIDRVLICVGDGGVSRKTLHIAANLERARIHATHPDIGLLRSVSMNTSPVVQAVLRVSLLKVMPESYVNRLVDTVRRRTRREESR